MPGRNIEGMKGITLLGNQGTNYETDYETDYNPLYNAIALYVSFLFQSLITDYNVHRRCGLVVSPIASTILLEALTTAVCLVVD